VSVAHETPTSTVTVWPVAWPISNDSPPTSSSNELSGDVAMMPEAVALAGPYPSIASWALAISSKRNPAPEVSMTSPPALPVRSLDMVRCHGRVEPSATIPAENPAPRALICSCRSVSESSLPMAIV